MPAGTWAVHNAKGIHYEGAKGEDVIIMLHGMRPGTQTAADEK